MTLLLTNEITTPILNFRFFLKELHTPLSYRITNDFLFATLFFIIRVIFNSFLIKEVFTLVPSFIAHGMQINVPPAVVLTPPVLAGLHVCLQYYWFALIVRMIVRKVRASAKSKSKSKSPPSPPKSKKQLQKDSEEREKLLLMDDEVADPTTTSSSLSSSPAKRIDSATHLHGQKHKVI